MKSKKKAPKKLPKKKPRYVTAYERDRIFRAIESMEYDATRALEAVERVKHLKKKTILRGGDIANLMPVVRRASIVFGNDDGLFGYHLLCKLLEEIGDS